jgi:signal transduction histidine kinase
MTMGRIGTLTEPKYCAVLRDITTFKRAERDFIEARRAAETASARKSDFLARISHEIRTPLSAIIGFAEIMHDERFGQLGNARYRDYLKDILNSGAHVLDLVNDLLDLSKIEAGRADLTFGEVDINTVLMNAANVLQETANKGSVVVRLSLASNLPSIVADERSLTQITLNILSNAIKFTPEGGQVIVSTARTADGEVAIRVKDTGVGMSEADIAMALEPFQQVSTTRKSGGTGLGLPLTKALVEANRASMAIRSARNTGTLVEILFPPTRVLADR